MAVTIREVAIDAGVSQATAARALGGYGYASPDVRHRVRDSAHRLGYMPNGVARALVSRATHTVGLVVGDIDNPFFAAAARGLSDVLEAAGYTVLLANADERGDREAMAVEALRRRRVDGLVVVPAPGTQLQDVAGAEVPLVQLDRFVRGLAADALLVENAAGAAGAVSHLVRLGHRRIGILSDTPRISSSAERISGYRRALGAAGIPVDNRLVAIAGATQAAGHAAARALLSSRHRPTALFTANNFMTIGALLAARELGLSIPGDLALVGFDDLEWTALVDPPLTAVRQPAGELGRAAGERLLARIGGDDGPPRRIRLQTTLVIRGSCGARS